MKKGRQCLCCGTTYQYCGTCPEDKYEPTTRALYCSDNCCTIFHAATDYGFGLLTKEEAKEALQKCNLSKLDTFKEIVKCDVKGILEEEKVEDDVAAKAREVFIPSKKSKFVEE